MAWPALLFILSAIIFHIPYASFLSTTDEFRRIDISAGPSKRHGVINEQPPPDVGEEVGFDEDPSCDVVMTQCQCEDNRGEGGGGGGWGGWSKGDDFRKGSRKRHGKPQDLPQDNPEESQLETPRGKAFGSPYDNPDGISEENLYGNPRKKSHRNPYNNPDGNSEENLSNPRKKSHSSPYDNSNGDSEKNLYYNPRKNAHSNPYDNLDDDSEENLYDNPPAKAHGSPLGDPHYGYSGNSQGWDYGDSDLPRIEARGINVTKLFVAGDNGGHFGSSGPHGTRSLPRKRYG